MVISDNSLVMTTVVTLIVTRLILSSVRDVNVYAGVLIDFSSTVLQCHAPSER